MVIPDGEAPVGMAEQPPPLPARPPPVENLVSLRSADGHKVWLDEASAKLSVFIADALAGSPGTVDLPPSVTGPTLYLVVVWLEHHRGVAPDPPRQPLPTTSMRGVVSNKWDADFIESRSDEQRSQLVIAAHDLGIGSLVLLTCAKIAARLKEVSICGVPGAHAVHQRWLSLTRSASPAASSPPGRPPLHP